MPRADQADGAPEQLLRPFGPRQVESCWKELTMNVADIGQSLDSDAFWLDVMPGPIHRRCW